MADNRKEEEDFVKPVSSLINLFQSYQSNGVSLEPKGKEEGPFGEVGEEGLPNRDDNDKRDLLREGGGIRANNKMAVDNEGLILPRKVHNPCIQSIDRQALHRELMFNQKLGKSVLNQKSELQRAMDKYKENQAKKEEEATRCQQQTPFERLIQERAKRLEILEREESEKGISSEKPEFLQIHERLKSKMESK